ncbi:DNA-binding response regulator [Luteitalea sp. TBR-22]|uniref:response regulator n=1 Tax=Luteitalea sp. TBR-22 TaxID=2802971 RepID=UPI001AF8EF8C|nr:response regulator transcription factor [Luteitalea sp. TBR-22]BCS34840.1 DNA-binding response regulator [Luteitalea sp. TBR-22]
MTPLRVVVTDDHALVRAGIRALLDRMPEVEVVAEGGTGEEALALVEALEPDVLLIDVALPGLSGLEVAARVRATHPRVKVIVLSIHDNEEYVMQALSAGAVGYLLKDAAASQLDLALAAVARNETYLSPAISRRVIDEYVSRVGGREPSSEGLTPRQREVVRFIAQGKSVKEIAFLLDLSVKTVETHRAQAMERLGIHDVAGLVRYAMRTGLIPPIP